MVLFFGQKIKEGKNNANYMSTSKCILFFLLDFFFFFLNSLIS